MADEDRPNPPRSVRSDQRSFVSFCNRSKRTVHLFWIDFTGQLKRYGRILPRGGVHINTFVTHPWVARDANTGFPLLFSGSEVFYPEPWSGERNRNVVNIHIPVYPLYRRCLEVVHYCFDREKVQQLDIPSVLKETLNTFVPVIKFTDYNNFHNMHYVHLNGEEHDDDSESDSDNDEENDESDEDDNVDDAEGINANVGDNNSDEDDGNNVEGDV